MRFNMMNWVLETISIILVTIDEDNVFVTLLFLLVTACGTPLVYWFNVEITIFRQHLDRIFSNEEVII